MLSIYSKFDSLGMSDKDPRIWSVLGIEYAYQNIVIHVFRRCKSSAGLVFAGVVAECSKDL